MISVGSEVQVLPGPPVLPLPTRFALRSVPPFRSGGHSSAGRAPALQAGGHRFESGCLHFDRFACGEHGRESEREVEIPRIGSGPRQRRWPRSGRQEAIPRRGGSRSETSFGGCRSETWSKATPAPQTVSRGKVTRSWRHCSSTRTVSLTLIVIPSTILFFVRVNQVLVRLWARAMEADAGPCSSRCPVDV